jgi:prepilin-type N-terminal cleavage/methylation domain-containing protein
MKRKGLSSRDRARGFSLIELVVALLIGGILLSIAMPIYQNAQTAGQNASCRANLESIANAAEQLRMKTASRAYTTSLSALSGELLQTPICPTGGTYTISVSNGTATSQSGQTVPSGGLVISCSNPAHGVFAPGIDTQ